MLELSEETGGAPAQSPGMSERQGSCALPLHVPSVQQRLSVTVSPRMLVRRSSAQPPWVQASATMPEQEERWAFRERSDSHQGSQVVRTQSACWQRPNHHRASAT